MKEHVKGKRKEMKIQRKVKPCAESEKKAMCQRKTTRRVKGIKQKLMDGCAP